MPQLSQIGEIYASQLFWLAIAFALIYFGIGRAMVPRIEATVADRDRRIGGDLNAAQTASASASELDASYQTGIEAARNLAQAAVVEATLQATRAGEAQLAAQEAASANSLEAAMARIAALKAQALVQIEGATGDAVEAIVGRLSGVSVARSTIDGYVRAELAHG